MKRLRTVFFFFFLPEKSYKDASRFVAEFMSFSGKLVIVDRNGKLAISIQSPNFI